GRPLHPPNLGGGSSAAIAPPPCCPPLSSAPSSTSLAPPPLRSPPPAPAPPPPRPLRRSDEAAARIDRHHRSAAQIYRHHSSAHRGGLYSHSVVRAVHSPSTSVVRAAGLGLSLVLIHIYITPIKRFLQALCAVGVLGSVGTYLVTAQPLDEGLVQYVLDHPAALWFVGPTFAALTGLVFKEAIGPHNFTLMHCWKILKDEPKWLELKRKMDQNSASSEQRNVLNLDLNSPSDDASPASSAGKRPMGRDAAKAAKRKAKLASAEHVSKIHELSVQKIELFKETEAERKARLDEMVSLEKVKVEEAREHRKQMLELEKERLAMEQKRLQMEVAQKEKEEDERIMAINLDQCQPTQRIYYQRLQDDILQKMMYRARGP
ncbi:unnamed protein product, partial [Urochloa humidicola]